MKLIKISPILIFLLVSSLQVFDSNKIKSKSELSMKRLRKQLYILDQDLNLDNSISFLEKLKILDSNIYQSNSSRKRRTALDEFDDPIQLPKRQEKNFVGVQDENPEEENFAVTNSDNEDIHDQDNYDDNNDENENNFFEIKAETKKIENKESKNSNNLNYIRDKMNEINEFENFLLIQEKILEEKSNIIMNKVKSFLKAADTF